MNTYERRTYLRQVTEHEQPWYWVDSDGGTIGAIWFSPKRKGKTHGGECWKAEHIASGRTASFETRTEAQEWVGEQW